jgi:hypothetical protein
MPENSQVLKHNKSSKMKRFVAGGRKIILPEDTLIKMKEYFEKMRSQNLSV